MNHKRPVNLDLKSLKFPPMAIVSILHRLSGMALFLLFPAILYLLSLSLYSANTFHSMQRLLTHPGWKITLWIFFAALTFHLLAGIRHMSMDLGFGEGIGAGRYSAFTVLTLAIILTIYIGMRLW